jgi:hypothetical protein
VRSLKGFLLLGVLAVIAITVLVPATWMYTLSNLPNAIDSELDVETHLRQSIESERQSIQLAKRPSERENVKWERPDFGKLPKNLIAFYITETGCPTYFQTPREDGWAWNKRELTMVAQNKMLDGDGACELIFARRIARRLGAVTPMQLTVASDRIHRFLQKDQLVAFDLHSMQFEHGMIGVEAAARELMQKPLADLTLAELAELQLAIPPWDYWEDIKECKNASLVRESRDVLLSRLAMVGLISEEMARTASAQPVRCLSVKR